jgi:hypothetical protein
MRALPFANEVGAVPDGASLTIGGFELDERGGPGRERGGARRAAERLRHADFLKGIS